MKEAPAPVALITGTSSGIGHACARYMATRGINVYGASRSKQEPFENFVPLVMDVTDDLAVQQGVQQVLDREGHIDVVINNAGIAYAGAIEDTTIEEARHQFEVNFFGVLRVCKAVLPSMRSRKKGLIITIGSIGGLIGLPYQALYSATKFALEGLVEGMRLELKGSGIKAVLIEPGDIRTNISQNRIISDRARESEIHSERFVNYVTSIGESERKARGPEVVAKLAYEVVNKQSPAVRYRLGSPSEHLGVILRKVLPSRLFEKIMRSSFKV